VTLVAKIAAASRSFATGPRTSTLAVGCRPLCGCRWLRQGRLGPYLRRPGLLKDLAGWCRQRNVRLAYSIPWEFTNPEDRVSFQNQNAAFLLQVAELMPVLKDPALGVCTNREYYSDTAGT